MCGHQKQFRLHIHSQSHTLYYYYHWPEWPEHREKKLKLCVQTKRVLAATTVLLCKRDREQRRNGRKCRKKCDDRIAHMSINVILNKIQLSYTLLCRAEHFLLLLGYYTAGSGIVCILCTLHVCKP